MSKLQLTLACWNYDRTRALVARNQKALSTFLRYSYEQGLSKELLQPEQLFAPQTLETFKV